MADDLDFKRFTLSLDDVEVEEPEDDPEVLLREAQRLIDRTRTG